MDHPIYSLLAAGYSCIGAVPDLLVTLIAIPRSGYCCGRGDGVIERDYTVAGKGVAEEVRRARGLDQSKLTLEIIS